MANRRDYDVALKGELRSKNPFSSNWSSQEMLYSRTAKRSSSDYSRLKPRSRWLTPTDYNMLEEVDIRPHGRIDQLGFFGYSSYDGTLQTSSHLGQFNALFSKHGVGTVFPSDLSNNALIKARAKVKSQDLNLAQAYAERAQTAEFVSGNLVRMAALCRNLRRRHLRDLLKTTSVREARRAFLNAWLEFQYAMRPLMGDIHGAVTQLDETPYDKYVVTVKARSQRKLDFDEMYHQAGSDDFFAHYQVQCNALYSSFVRIDLVPSNGALITAASLGFTNPLYLAWELTKLSFVVDWAYPLGSYFNQLDALAGWEVKGYSQSNLIRISSVAKGLSYNQSDGYPVTQNWEGRYRHVSLARDGGTDVPLATFPSLKNPVSGVHVMNALALLTQACKL